MQFYISRCLLNVRWAKLFFIHVKSLSILETVGRNSRDMKEQGANTRVEFRSERDHIVEEEAKTVEGGCGVLLREQKVVRVKVGVPWNEILVPAGNRSKDRESDTL